MVILENIDIDKAILQNIDIDKISNRFKFGISNRAILTPSISAVSCSAEATRSPRSMLKSWCLTSEIRNLWIITSCTRKSQNLHVDAVSSTDFNLVSKFTPQTALLQEVPPGTLEEEGQEVLQDTAGPCWRSTAASGSNQW